MPKLSYLQTIARRAKSHLPLLMPPRSPLSRVEVPLMPELPDELRSVQSSSPVKGTAISPQQQFPGTPLQEVAVLPPRSPTDVFNTTSPPVPSRVELPQEIKTVPVFSEMSSEVTELISVSPVVKSSLQPPSKLTSQPITSVTQPLQSSDLSAKLPDSSAMSDIAQATPVPKARSYLQTAARILMPEPGSTVPSAPSAETATPEATSAETVAPKVSESVVILQPPRSNPVSKSSSSENQNIDLLPPWDRRPSHSPTPTATSPANTVHIGTIDIHITPPPTPPVQPVATAPKPVSLTPLARGFTSGFGLRQG